jgi:HSP20 family protein
MRGEATFAPRVDVAESDKQFEVTVELPGMNKEDIDINMEGNVLTVSGERRFENKEENKNYRRIESSYGFFTRSIPFPDVINPDKINAKYDQGLLRVTIPKVKEKAGKKIEVS